MKPPKLGVNPKGFWEPEAVLDLDVRVMRQLGGDWSNVNFSLPSRARSSTSSRPTPARSSRPNMAIRKRS